MSYGQLGSREAIEVNERVMKAGEDSQILEADSARSIKTAPLERYVALSKYDSASCGPILGRFKVGAFLKCDVRTSGSAKICLLIFCL